MRFIALFLTLLAFVAQPAAAASSPSLTSLEQQLSSLVAGKSADVGIAALDLNTGETVSIKGNTPFPMASTVKVAIAALYLAQVDHGRRSLDDTINGTTARSLMARMLIHSDNRATDILLEGPRRSRRGPRLAAGQWRHRASRRPHDRAAAGRQARPVGPPRFQHADGDGRPSSAHLQGGADQAREPQLSARPDVAVPDRQEPDEGAAAVGNAGRA